MRDLSSKLRLRLPLLILAATLGLGMLPRVSAQDEEDEAPPPAPDKGSVKIVFTPPPMDGTYSIGVYAADGKLVRVLHSEAGTDAFVAGLNGLITHWNGLDDSGKPAPAGKYSVRGFCVGELEIEGRAFWGNDWFVDESSPRIVSLGAIRVDEKELRVNATTVDGKSGVWKYELGSGKESFDFTETPGVEKQGEAGDWKIETIQSGEKTIRVVTQRQGDEIVRSLEIPPDQPQPESVIAVPGRDEIFLSERDAASFRIRGLRLKETEAVPGEEGRKVSRWEVFLSKSLRKSDTFAAIETALGKEKTPSFQARETVRIRLINNALENDAPSFLALSAAVDAKGSALRTGDGLPLRTVTDTAGLKWVVIGPAMDGASKSAVTLFQSDGSVVEEYRIGKLNNMMGFDAGEYSWAGPDAKSR